MNVYRRTDIRLLASREAWIRKGRRVKDEEQPVKNDLFRESQTEEYVPVTVGEKDDIPVNGFGNIEIFHDRMIPYGCVHVDAPYIKTVAKELQIQAVPAVTGFSFGRNKHPVIEGVIVKNCDMDVLREAVNVYARQKNKGRSKKSKN